HFFTCNPSKYDKNWNEQFNLFEIKANKSAISFIIVTDSNTTPDIQADLLTLPKTSIPVLSKQKEILINEIESINNELNTIAATTIPILTRKIESTQGIIDFKTVELQVSKEADEKLNIIEGWVPEDKEDELILQLQESGTYFVKSKPSKKDNVPILLKNNAFTKLFELVGSLYSLPSYREIDLTPFFAPFFMLFFGFCLGDAGYGIIIMLATLILRAKAKPNMKPVWTLGFLFGVATVIMGLLGGTIFGIMLIDLNFNWLSTFQSIILDQNQLMYFSIALGLIQIVFGMCLKAARAIKIDGIKYALSTIGWIIIIVGVGTSFGLSKQEIIKPELAKYLMIGFGGLGGILVLFFNSPGKNIFLNFGLGLWDTYGTLTGLLGDVLSYIRLFALGLSSAVLGSVFNQLAFDLTGDIPVLSVVFTILILLVGHSINFFMAALGSFVHPLRLTFVEFYKNTGFEGGGKKYTPFKEVVK
nr:V-type ATP synthase subunit I [Prolixibacteraceae bacterium]